MSIPSVYQAIPAHIIDSVNKLDFDLAKWDRNPRIGGLLSQTVLGGGKRLRPLISFLMADVCGIKHEQQAPFSRVVELVHAATLAHDDVIDNAEVRRGLPSINARSTNKTAVLAGDYLLAYAVEQVARKGNPDIVVRLTEVISDLAEGEWLQIENSESSSLQWDDIVRVAAKKTGSVLRWCTVVPAILAGFNDELINKAADLGLKIGIAFQMTDDILDFKRRDGAEFADLKNGVINSVIFQMMRADNQEAVFFKGNAKPKLDNRNLDQAIDRVASYASQQLDDCRQLLNGIVAATPELTDQRRANAFEAMGYLIEFIEKRV